MALLALGVLVAGGLGVAAVSVGRPAAPVISSGEASIGGPFHLSGVDGRPVDQRVLDGKWSAVFFGYTNCPDTPAQMKLYVSSQGYPAGGLVGLTGTEAQVKAVAGAYHAFYAKQGSGPDYAMQHSAAIYLMDPHGRFVKPLNETDPPPALAAQIREAMAA